MLFIIPDGLKVKWVQRCLYTMFNQNFYSNDENDNFLRHFQHCGFIKFQFILTR